MYLRHSSYKCKVDVAPLREVSSFFFFLETRVSSLSPIESRNGQRGAVQGHCGVQRTVKCGPGFASDGVCVCVCLKAEFTHIAQVFFLNIIKWSPSHLYSLGFRF